MTKLVRGLMWGGKIQWCKGHREQLWQLIEAGLNGVEPGDLICKSYERDLRQAGYAVRNSRGLAFATPKGEKALRRWDLSDGRVFDA